MGRRGLHLLKRKIRRCLRSVRRRIVLPKHGKHDVPWFRQAPAEGTNHLLLPHHSGQARHVHGWLSDHGALSVRKVLVQILPKRCLQQQHGVDDLCRCPDWRSCRSGRQTQRKGPVASQRVWVRISLPKKGAVPSCGRASLKRARLFAQNLRCEIQADRVKTRSFGERRPSDDGR